MVHWYVWHCLLLYSQTSISNIYLYLFQLPAHYPSKNILRKHLMGYSGLANQLFTGKEWGGGKDVACKQGLTISSFSIRASREGMSAVCRVPSSVVQAAKAGMKTWWTALTTRSEGSASESSISSKPWRNEIGVWGIQRARDVNLKKATTRSTKTDILYSMTLFSPNTHLGVLVRVVDVTHDDSQALDHSLPDHVSLILSQHLLQHGQDQGAPDLLLRRQRARWMKRINFSAFCSQVICTQKKILFSFCEHSMFLQAGTVLRLHRTPPPTISALDICG